MHDDMHFDVQPFQPPKSMVESADDLERGLAMCLIEYRRKAEDLLQAHFEAIERAESAHRFESAKLIAENGQLREHLLSLGVTGIPPLLQAQPVMMEEAGKKDKGGKAQPTHSRSNARKDDDEDDSSDILSIRNKGANKNNYPPGTWQQFVAWVPNGAALNGQEPWKPLPPQSMGLPLTPQQSGQARRPGFGAVHSVPAAQSRHKSKFLAAGSAKGAGGSSEHLEASSDLKRLSILPGSPEEAASEDRSDSSNNTPEECGNFQLLDTWVATEREKKKIAKGFTANASESAFSDVKSDAAGGGTYDELEKRAFVISPDGSVRITWDLISLAMVIYDMIMIPMAVFSMQETLFLVMMEWCTRVFWTVDIGWSCLTGIARPDGTVDYKLPNICRKYAKTWLGLDLFIVGSDWGNLVFASGGLKLGSLVRISRIARVIRLLRMVRMQEVIRNVTENVQSDKLIIVLQVTKLVLFLATVSHMTACVWWSIGIMAGETWATEANYEAESVGVQYLVCLQWAMAQFTGGMDEIVAVNAFERFFAVVMWLFGFTAAAVITSILTSILTQQYIIGGAGARKMAILRKYLNQNRITGNLAKRLVRNAKHAISGDLTPETVELLSVVSEPLLVEMHFQMFRPVLCHHPFFSDACCEAAQLMRNVCHNAMTTQHLSAGDVVFTNGEVPPEPKMYFCINGSLEYWDADSEVVTITDFMWVAEAVLWTSWKHQGNLVAISDVKLAVLDAQTFTNICRRWMKKLKDGFSPKHYAAQFIELLNSQSKLTDLSIG